MITLVTDSTCDIPAEYRETNDLYVIPALVNIGQQTLRDGVDISRDAFYDLLPTLPHNPTTSAPGPAAFVETYERALQTADQVVGVFMASKLSGLYNAARLAAREVAPERIHLIDSGQLSMGVGWPVMAGLEAARAGEPVEAVIHSIRDTLSRVRVYALLDTVEYLARSGRVSMMRLGLSNLLSIKPIVELHDGTVTSLARVRTWSRAVDTLVSYVTRLAPLERLAIMHSSCIDCATDLFDRIRGVVPPFHKVVTTNATTVIGAHIGPGAVGIAAVLNTARK